MNEYIFYTPEGYTSPPKENMTVENCQLLGFAKGLNKEEALDTLIADNPWIEECGFEVCQIIGVQVIRE